MSLVIRPKAAHRELDLDKPYLRLHATFGPHTGPVYDRDGNEVGVIHACEIRDPSKLPEPDIRLAEQRAAICEDCDQFKGATLRANDRDVYTVKCRQCGCGGLSLVRGKCPARKWV